MAISKENYQITANDLQGLINRLNSSVLNRISDRLDKLEGFRGELETASGTFTGDVKATAVKVVDSNNTTIQQME